MLWHQSLKSIHYRILLIFQNKKNNRFEGQNMGGDKRHVIPPMSKHGGDISPPSPPGFTPLHVCEPVVNDNYYRPISQTMFMLSIAINRAEHVCATVIIKHNYMLMCNHKIVINIMLCLLNSIGHI